MRQRWNCGTATTESIRALKTSVDENGDEQHTARVVAILELRRAAWDEPTGDDALTPVTEVGYLLVTRVRPGRLHFDESDALHGSSTPPIPLTCLDPSP